MKFVDVHCHLDFDRYGEDRFRIAKEMQERNIMCLTNTLNPKNYDDVKVMFKDYENVKVCPGLYPQDAEKISDEDFENYLKLIEKEKNKIVAIGEVGLDKHHTEDEKLFDLQVKRFKKLVELAIKIDKPMLIHTRKAEGIILDILREYVEKTGFRKFDLHCFMGKKKFIKDIKELNIYCSIPLIIKNTECFQILVKELPIRQLLVETDAPFLHPDKEINSPLNIPEIYDEIAKIKGYDKLEVQNMIFNNYMKFTR